MYKSLYRPGERRRGSRLPVLRQLRSGAEDCEFSTDVAETELLINSANIFALTAEVEELLGKLECRPAIALEFRYHTFLFIHIFSTLGKRRRRFSTALVISELPGLTSGLVSDPQKLAWSRREFFPRAAFES